MPKFSQASLDKLFACDARLVGICTEAINAMDFTVLCGHRGKEEQNKAYAEGKSKLQWPLSKHNSNPSMAVDLAPFPIDWNDIERFRRLAILIKKVASEKQIAISWGGDWKMRDYPHFELVE